MQTEETETQSPKTLTKRNFFIREQTAPKEESSLRLLCPERQTTVDHAVASVETAFHTIGLTSFDLPEVKIKFVKSREDPVLGQVNVDKNGVEIAFDKRFSTQEAEARVLAELQREGLDYPGMQQALKHELAHIAMWSITGISRQPATRLIDEGWASLVEDTDDCLPTELSKQSIQAGLLKNRGSFARCLEFRRPILPEEDLNAAEYQVGKALLLWVHERYGLEKMIELMKKSISSERRNDDFPEGAFEPATVDDNIHTTAPAYREIIGLVNQGKISSQEAQKRAKEWEGLQFETALLEVTGLKQVNEVKKQFLAWIEESIDE